MKLSKESEEHLRTVIRKAIPSLKTYKRELEIDSAISSLLYEQVISSLTALNNLAQEINRIDDKRMSISKNQIKLYEDIN